jgi:TonB family protein
MTSFVNYLIESGISLSLFALVYFLFLRRETFFSINRWFLLFSIGFSAILPLLRIPFYTPQPTVLAEVTVTPYVNLLSVITVYGTGFTQNAETFVLSYSLFGYLYLFGVGLFAMKFFIQLFQIFRMVMRNKLTTEGKIKLVVLDKDLSPFSFLNYIFVSKNLQNTNGWEKMLEHERQHIRQGHTFDVLLLEIIAIVQWFNPFFWMFRRALRENHEFLADQAVISHGTAPSWYKQILINQYVGDQIVIANNFNYSLIKIRIKMMSKIKSSKIANVKVLVGIVLAAGLITVFACEQKQTIKAEAVVAEKTETISFQGQSLKVSGDSTVIDNLKSLIRAEKMGIPPPPPPPPIGKPVTYDGRDDVYVMVEEMPEFPGGVAALRNFLAQAVKYPTEAVSKGIQGKVYVTFVVNKDGSVSNAKITRGVDPLLDAESVRVVNSLPPWKPGKEKGQVVDVQFTVPINFTLE